MAAVICGHSSAYAQQPTNIKIVADALIMTRSDVASHPILYDAPWPAGSPLLDASDINLNTIWSGRLEATLHELLHIGYLQTENATAHETRSSSPADVEFFNGFDANPANTYTARYTSKFWLGDVSVANRIHPKVSVWAGVGFGELKESFDLLSGNEGFFSDTKNKLVGFHAGSDITVWSNGFSRIEGGVNGGIYYNNIDVYAEAINVSQIWSQDETTFIGGANIAWVIPFWPVNFRIGYQAFFLSRVALAPDQSAVLDLSSSSGNADVGDVFYHGGIIGLEFAH